MKSWLRHSVEEGIVTTRFPETPATQDELPVSGRALVRPAGTPLPETVRSACPTRALGAESIDQGRCVRCARCASAGIGTHPDPARNVGRRSDLLWPGGSPPEGDGQGRPPLGALGRSLHLFVIDVGSCQACNWEVLGLAGPYYDLHRLGLFFTNSPRHADILVVVGVPTPEMVEPLRRTYEALPHPKAVLAVGACAIDGGVFEPGATDGGGTVGAIVPVDRYVAGCPPPPVAILEGLLSLGHRRLRGGTAQDRGGP
ncbi:MAG: NADH:ubiquinone oxidoreductase [Thermoplasmata archaeon]